ncbi:hypothetical protein LTR94_026097, partial [Friedmanniomyces endolithicus]
MKVAVLGASGRAGSEIAKELAARGHSVVAIARNPAAIPTHELISPVAGDASDAAGLAALVAGTDAVISALHHNITADVLIAALKTAQVARLLVTGGAGSLEVAPGVRLIDTPDFPEAFKPYALPGVAFLEALREETDLDWTFFSPAALIEEGPRLGVFRTDTDRLIVDDKGESRISFADYAIAMVDELETP